MLEVLNLDCVRGERRLFSRLNFSLQPGHFVQAFGPNGSGKTSLLRIICGLMIPAAGEVRWAGTNIRRLGEEYFAQIAYVAHQNGVKDELNPLENLCIASGIAGRSLTNQEAESLLQQVGLSKQRYLPARLLSAGQRRRLALSRLLATKARLWILDEPLSWLDDAGANLVRRLVDEHLTGDGMAIIATHQEMGLSAGRAQQINF